MLETIIKPLFFISPDPEKALGLELFVPNLYIIYHNDSPYIEYFKKCGVIVFKCQKNILPITHKILSSNKVYSFIKKHTQDKTPEILCFKSSLQIERFCNKKNYLLLNNKVNIAKQFENKISQYTWLKSLNIKIPDTKCNELWKLPLERLFTKWKKKTVLQFSKSHSGLGTHLCLSLDQLKKMILKFPYRKVRFCKFIKGENWTINACATKNGTYFGGLSFQLTGLPLATNYLGATVGNDWSYATKLTSYQINLISMISTKIGDSLYKQGFKGLFGIDFRINHKNIYVLEVNARQVASIPTHNHLAFKKGIVPLSLLHIAEYKSATTKDMFKIIEQYFNKKNLSLKNYNKLAHTFMGSRLIVNNNNYKPLLLSSKKSQDNIYSLKMNLFLKRGLVIDDLKFSDEILYMPRSLSDIINTNTKMFQLLSNHSLLKKNNVLLPNVVKLINILKTSYEHP